MLETALLEGAEDELLDHFVANPLPRAAAGTKLGTAAAADAPSTVDFTSAQVAMEVAEGVGRRDEAVREGGSADHVI